jgi:hypothetical protein
MGGLESMLKDYDYYVRVGSELIWDRLWEGVVWVFMLLIALPMMCLWNVIAFPLWLIGKLTDKS